MKPPICTVCRKRFDPSRSPLVGGGGLVHFADYRPPSAQDPPGHPAGAEWFCRRHYRVAKSLQDRPLGEAMAVFRARWWLAAGVRLGLVLIVLLAAATAWNVTGPVELGPGSDVALGRFSEGRLAGRETDARGAALAASWIDSRTEPTWNPLEIAWHQLKYNAWTEGYDLVLWLEPEPETESLSSRRYALYQTGRTVFLRIEYEGKNRVLDASFTPEELEAALEPYLKRPTAPGPTQSEAP